VSGVPLCAPGALGAECVVVTGATRGIGFAVARAFLDAGARVIGTGRTHETVDAAAASLGPRFRGLPVDLGDRTARAAFLESIGGEPVTALVNNAGINILADIRDVRADDWDQVVEINLTAPADLSRAIAARLAGRGGGRIVHIASVWAVVGRPRRNAYASTKAGLVGLTRTMALDLGRDGVLVNAVCPGFTDTELTRRTNTPEELQRIEAGIPIGRMASSAEVASLIVFLGSPLNTYITGQAITIDGGYTIQ